MAIDIDKGFKKISELRFYEIKKEFCEQIYDKRRNNHKRLKKPKPKGLYRTPEQQAVALEIMKKALINGFACKVAIMDSGYKRTAAANLFKRKTGMTMTEFQLQNQTPQVK